MMKLIWPVGLLLTTGACVGTVEPGGAGGAGERNPRNPRGTTTTTTPTGGTSSPGGVAPGTTVTTNPPPPPQERPAAAAVSTTRFARLSHRQYENTVRDLLGLPSIAGLAAKFPTDATGTFTNNGEVLAVSDNLRIDYQATAEELAQRVARDPAVLSRIVPADAPAAGKERALAFIRDFGRRAYRRPLEPDEITSFATLFEQAPTLVPGVDAFAAGVQLTLEAMLQSPHFLYRTELGTGPGRQRLGPYEIASKLSYALTGSMPDEALFTAAADGKLSSYEQVSAEVDRLLGKNGGPGVDFHEDLFQLRSLGTDIEKDPQKFPEWKPAWRDSIVKEGQLFLGAIFNGDKGLSELLTAPFTFVDATLAPLYGVKAPSGSDLLKVDLDPQQRAGLLTQTAFLTRHGETESDIILRGAFINRALLCLDLAPPPGVTEMIMQPPASARTNRQRVEAITSPNTCAACHKGFVNPAGSAFENFDALGRYRTTEGGEPVNAADSYSFASGAKAFKNGIEFSRLLAESPEVHECYARGWFSYLQGRSARAEDEPFVKWMAARSLGERASLRSLAMTVVTDDSFLTRLP